MAKIPEMTTSFASWYSKVFMDEGATRDARWKGVVDTALEADLAMVEVLLRLAFGTGAPGGNKNEDLAASYGLVLDTIGGDGTKLDPSTSQRELQVLAAAVLVRLFTNMPDAALGVTTTSFNGVRKPDLPMDLAGLASRALVDLSRRNHNRPAAKDLEVATPKVDFELSPEAVASFDPTTWKGELDRLRDATRAATRFMVDGQNRVVKRLSRQIELGNEELQMLWWLIGEHSAVAAQPFAKVDAALKPIAFASELASLTTISPGPASVFAMLSRAGVANKSVKIKDAVNAPTLEWAKDASSSTSISPISTPLHFALEKRSEIGNDDAWQSVWSAMTGFSGEASLPAVRLAELFYREHLFLHVAG